MDMKERLSRRIKVRRHMAVSRHSVSMLHGGDRRRAP
jgi:hypothetical protein